MIDDIKLPENLTRIVLIINIIILASAFAVDVISTNSAIPKPLNFIFSSILSIFICLGMLGYQQSINNNFMREYADKSLRREYHYYEEGYADSINISNMVSVLSFFIIQIASVISQFI